MASGCQPHHDWRTLVLTSALCLQITISFLPQHIRIIKKGSSEGFSPWFLLLGSTSSTAGLLNMVTLQWGIIKCCRVFTFGTCLEMVAGVVLVGLQWVLFTLIFVLFMIYYPPHLKYVTTTHDMENRDSRPSKDRRRSKDWRLSIILAWTVVSYLLLITFVTFFILLTTSSASPRPQHLIWWAGFLGISSATLAAIQYLPQLLRTYRAKIVGALSILMMLQQTPGAIGLVISIAVRPGTNWTSWITYAVSGSMQACLLGMCIAWKFRQRRLKIDDFGNPIDDQSLPVVQATDPDENAAPIIEEALNSAAEEDVRSGVVVVRREPDGEETPLLGKSADDGSKGGSWFGWMRRQR